MKIISFTSRRRIANLFTSLFPYLLSLVIGIVLYLVSVSIDSGISPEIDALREVALNLSASFFAILLIFFVFETTAKEAKRKLNRELYEFTKKKFDTVIIRIFAHVQHVLVSYENYDSSTKNFNRLLKLSIEDIAKQMNHKYLGFQLFKSHEQNIHDLESLIYTTMEASVLEDDNYITILEIIKVLINIDSIKNDDTAFEVIPTQEVTKLFIINGIDFSPDNAKYPSRFLLLERIDNEKGKVIDFGDFDKFRLNQLLNEYMINEKYRNKYSVLIFMLFSLISEWVERTGNTLLLDSRLFREVALEPYSDLKQK
jgi:hypothetical protein